MAYGCIGRVLKHSFSKEIHEELADNSYKLIELEPNEIDGFMKSREFKAVNVTIPYKETVIPYLDFIDENAKKIGAVNTVVNRSGKLYGYNTDFSGMKALIDKSGISFAGKKVLILGGGGTSKTALAVATDLNASSVLRVSRSKKEGYITYDDAYSYHRDAEIIINTTPVGMFPNINEAAIDIDKFSALSGVVDAVYNPLKSLLIVKAELKNINAIGGLYMLVAQAAYASEHFTGIPVKDRIDEVYKKLLKSKQNIVLTGMPGSGKTTVGKMLAEKLNMEFIDTDEVIESSENRKIASIIENEGESHFRQIETNAVKSVSAFQGKVIATGGGVILKNENINLLRQNGMIYFLDRKLEDIIPTANRPLSNDFESLKKRYEERYETYKKTANRRILNENPDNAAEEIIKDFLL